jgi:hypothetical protein
MASVAASNRPMEARSPASAVAWSLAGLYVVLVLLAFRFGSEAAPITLVDVWIFFAMLWFAVIGALIVGRHARHPIGWMFCTTALSFGALAFAQSYAIVAITADHRGLPAGQLMAWLGFWINMPGTAVIALFLPLLFPDGILPSRRWRPGPATSTHLQAPTGIDDLLKLKELHDHGVLTDEEFSAKKRLILGI